MSKPPLSIHDLKTQRKASRCARNDMYVTAPTPELRKRLVNSFERAGTKIQTWTGTHTEPVRCFVNVWFLCLCFVNLVVGLVVALSHHVQPANNMIRLKWYVSYANWTAGDCSVNVFKQNECRSVLVVAEAFETNATHFFLAGLFLLPCYFFVVFMTNSETLEKIVWTAVQSVVWFPLLNCVGVRWVLCFFWMPAMIWFVENGGTSCVWLFLGGFVVSFFETTNTPPNVLWSTWCMVVLLVVRGVWSTKNENEQERIVLHVLKQLFCSVLVWSVVGMNFSAWVSTRSSLLEVTVA